MRLTGRNTREAPRFLTEVPKRLVEIVPESCRATVMWSADESDACPHCGALTPAPYMHWRQGWVRLMPVPCRCAKSKALRRGDERDAVASRGVPEQYVDVVAGLTVDEYTAAVKDGSGLYFHGGPGTGKTATAYAICAKLRGEGWRCVVTSIGRVLTRMHDAFRSGAQQAVIDSITGCGLLVLDDVGKEQTREAVSLLYQIVDERCLRDRPIIITSNYGREKLGPALLNGCDAATVSAIMSRLSQMTVPVYTGEEDRRIA